MAAPARKRATYADVLAAPPDVIAEVVDGVLYTSPRPGIPHAAATSALHDELGPPELHLGPDVLVPDLAGWRRERMPVIPSASHLTISPDWVCKVLSVSTAKIDKAEKLPTYARHGVPHAWLVDPILRTLDILRLEGQSWSFHRTYAEAAEVRAEPFDAIAFDLGALWADVERAKE